MVREWSQVVWRRSLPRGLRASRSGLPPPQRSPPDHPATRQEAPRARRCALPPPLFRGIITGDEPDELMEFRHETVADYNALDLVCSVDPFPLSQSGTGQRRGRARVVSLELSPTT